MAVASSTSLSLIQSTLERCESLLDSSSKATDSKDNTVSELLLARDRLTYLLQQSGSFDAAVISRISSLDQRLRRSRRLFRFDGPGVDDLRSLVNPPKRHWWWYPPPPNPLWTVTALFFLTVSVSILTDFVRRLLTSGPDEIGLLSIAVQGLFTVGATSTFTSAGGQGIQSLLSRLGIEDGHRPAVRLWASVTLFAIVFCAWKFLPDRLAEHYNDIAFRQTYSDPDAARENYGKAISLNPRIPQAHYNLGTLYENAYEYDRAAAEYRRAIVVDPNHVIAYSNLSRLLLMGNDPLGALLVADDALKLPAKPTSEVSAALYRNRALAEYQLGFYRQAEVDAKLSSAAMPSAAGPYCVLAKIYGKTGRTADANQAWQKFLSASAPSRLQPRVEPDCIHLAEEANHENH